VKSSIADSDLELLLNREYLYSFLIRIRPSRKENSKNTTFFVGNDSIRPFREILFENSAARLIMNTLKEL